MIEILGYALVGILSFIGTAVVILKFFSLSTSAWNWWADLLNSISKKRAFKKLRRTALKTDIARIVNTTVFELQKELPNSWVKKMHLKWVEKGNLTRLKSGESIIRIQPSDKQDFNVINGVYYYFHHALFPETYEVVPNRILNALAIRLGERTIQGGTNSKHLLPKFKETIMEREVQNDGQILEFLDPFTNLDNHGFLTGAMIREIDEIASKIRFKKERNRFETDVKDVMEHMLEFVRILPTGQIPEHKWYFENDLHNYRFLLSARISKMKIDRYLNRAIQAYDQGVERLYVFGSNSDIDFTNKLIRRIPQSTEFILEETFDLEKDYRTNKKGIGALFVRKN